MGNRTIEKLYKKVQFPGEYIPINVNPTEINDKVPSDMEIWWTDLWLWNGWGGGVSDIRAEYIKGWLLEVAPEDNGE